MPESQSFGTVPTDVLRRFERTKGVPPQLIAEMFSRIEAPEAVCTAFWNALLAKKTHLDHGFVRTIAVDVTGRVGVFIDDGGVGLWVYAPDELTEGQYNALKDAFDRGLAVDVFWQTNNNGQLVVVYVMVYGPPPK